MLEVFSAQSQKLLDSVKQLLCHQRQMFPLNDADIGFLVKTVSLPAKFFTGGDPAAKFSGINGIGQKIFHRSAFERISPGGADPGSVQPESDLAQRISLELFPEDQGNERRCAFLGDEFRVFHPVAEGRDGNRLSAGEFFYHPPADLPGQVQGIVFVHGL